MNRTPEFAQIMPETPILVYPSIAATLGLEEATMVSLLTAFVRSNQGSFNNGYSWFSLNQQHMGQMAPFWQPADVQRICTNLREQGVLLIGSAPYANSHQLKFAFNQKQVSTAPQSTPAAPFPQQPIFRTQQPPIQNTSKNLIAPSWQPDRDTLARLAQHNITQSFALERVPEFITYWTERGITAHSWGSKFFQHVLRAWREFESQQHALSKETAMPRNWRPSQDALEVLVRHAGISLSFVEDAIPEFELYWREQAATSDNWNKKFRDHVNRQWLRYCSALEHDTVPRRIPENWEPSEDVYEVLRLANIDIPFAHSLLREFVIYWRDSNQVHSSWNTRFLQFVKQRWAKRHAQPDANTRPTRELTLAEQLTDRSWAI